MWDSVEEPAGKAMDLGLFTMPSHPPERELREGWEWDLQMWEGLGTSCSSASTT
jgi:hypothetical protein